MAAFCSKNAGPDLGAMFRYDGDGRVTRYRLGPEGLFITATGYFETLVKNLDGSFIVTQKDKTTHTFKSIPGTPYLVGGPVWRLTNIVDRNGNTTTLSYTGGSLTSITDTYGRSLVLAYTTTARINSRQSPIRSAVSPGFNTTPLAALITITDPNNKSIQYNYHFLYQLTRKVDRDGRTFSYAYANNEPVAVQ